MKDFEASAEPLQECLNATELAVQESSTRLHDLTAKKLELHKLQVPMSTEPGTPVMLRTIHVQAQPPLCARVPTGLSLSFAFGLMLLLF